MAGHSRAATVAAIKHRVETLGGLTTMLPSEDGAAVGEGLSRRFGLASWSFTLSSTDANRWAIRIARHITSRVQVPRALVENAVWLSVAGQRSSGSSLRELRLIPLNRRQATRRSFLSNCCQ